MRPDEPAGRVRLTGAPTMAALGVLAVLALSVALRFPWLAAERLWFDEVFSVVVASQEIGELLRRVVADETNPPGFYLLLGAWVRLGGYEEAWIRTLPAVAGTLVPLMLVLAARVAGVGWRPAIVGGLLAAASPLLIAKSIDVRSYALLALVATSALAFALWLARRPARIPRGAWMALAALHLLTVSVHYFGALTVVALTLAGSVVARDAGRERLVAFALAALPALIALGAWLVLVARLTGDAEFGENAAWIAEPSLGSAPSIAAQYVGAFSSRVFAWGVAAVVAGTLAWAVIARDRLLRALAMAVLVPLALALIVGWALDHPIWVGRYLIATVPPLMLVLALALERLGDRAGGTARHAIVTFTLGWAMLAGLHDLAAAPRKPDWPAIIGALSRHGPATACVNEGYVGLGLEYYAVRDRGPLEVRLMRDCVASDRLTWAVYRPGTERALEELVARGARLGPRFSLVTEMPPTEARLVHWDAPATR